MSILTTKKNKLMTALRNVELEDSFTIIGEDSDFIALQSNQRMGNGYCLVTLDLHESVHNCIYYCLGALNNPLRKETMLSLMNEFNKDNLALKFYLEEDNSVMVRVTYMATSETFEGDVYVLLMKTFFEDIRDNYINKIMRVIWG